MSSVFLLLSLAAASCTQAQFEQYKKDFGKSYDSQDEETRRFTTFCASLERIEALNKKNGETVFGLSFYTDREGAELPFRGRAKGHSEVEAPLHETKLAAPPKNVDWRLTKAVTAVKNQGQCGSCWAMSATEATESSYILHVSDDHAVNFSPQQVASCTAEPCMGCGGGFTQNAYEYLKGSKGLSPEAYWPYAQGLTPLHECSDTSCTQSCSTKNLDELEKYAFYIGPHATVEGFTYAVPKCEGSCEHQNLEQLSSVLAETPLSVCVDASMWNDYTGGVMSYDACGPSGADDLDHCVQLVGYNTTAEKPYWIVRNSWSETWGEGGYIYLEYGKNTCGLANEATAATVKTKSEGETPFARLYEKATGEKPVFKQSEVVV
jgi:C1A family cysteine protease